MKKLTLLGTRPEIIRLVLLFKIVSLYSEQIFEFKKLVQIAICVLSDSALVQEEFAIFGVAKVTLCDFKERPKNIGFDANILSGVVPQNFLLAAQIVIEQQYKC